MRDYVADLLFANVNFQVTSDRLLSLRLHLGLKQSEVARLLGVAESTYRGWETGRTECKGAAARLVWILSDLVNNSLAK